MSKITKVRLPDHIEEELATFMAANGVGSHDKNALIARAVDFYLADRRFSVDDGLSAMIINRSRARSEKGKEIWQKAKAGEKA